LWISSWRICATARGIAYVFEDELMFPIGEWIKEALFDFREDPHNIGELHERIDSLIW
jgi:hypothetical protein